jgi:hypothetical protein
MAIFILQFCPLLAEFHTRYNIIINRKRWLQNAMDPLFKQQQILKNFGSPATTVRKEAALCIIILVCLTLVRY